MKDGNKTKEQLIQELEALRRRTTELELSKTERKQAERKLINYREHLDELVKERTAELTRINERLEQEITDHERTEAKLDKLYRTESKYHQELERQMKQRVDFTRALVHELKTPLTPVLGASGILAEKLDDEPWLSLAQNIHRGAHNLNKRIDELLDLARGEIGMLKVDLKPVNPLSLLLEVVDYIRPQASVNGQFLTTEISPSLSSIKVDKERLRQVVLNFLDNASKFTPRGGKITLKAREEGGCLTVEVQDTGRGIDKEQQQRIFQPYFRLESDRQHFSGLGLGLALSKMLVELHGGDIWVKSQNHKGCTFGFSIPSKSSSSDTGKQGAGNKS